MPSHELARLAGQHPRMALKILAHPGLSLRGLEAILANLLPFGPRPAHALAAARNPALPQLFLMEPRAMVPVWSLLLHLGQAALGGALQVARQLPWSARHHLEGLADVAAGDSVPGAARWASGLPEPFSADPTPLETLVPRVFWRDARFRMAHAVLAHAEESTTLEGLRRGADLFTNLTPLGVTAPPLWQCMARSL